MLHRALHLRPQHRPLHRHGAHPALPAQHQSQIPRRSSHGAVKKAGAERSWPQAGVGAVFRILYKPWPTPLTAEIMVLKSFLVACLAAFAATVLADAASAQQPPR